MVEFEEMTPDKMKELISLTGFDFDLLTKDYFITLFLFLLKDVKGIYFKGGTALQKILLDYSRLSEDIDFTVTRNLENVIKDIRKKLGDNKLVEKITMDKKVSGFTRLVIHYKNFSNQEDKIFIDLNKRAKLFLKPQKLEIKHFYSKFMPSFSINCLNKKEMIAEKMTAAITRNKPRDHFDLFELIQKKFEIDLKLVEKKCLQQGKKLSIPKIFHNANKLKNQWNQDLLPLTSKQPSFETTMKTLAKHFNLKKHKKKN